MPSPSGRDSQAIAGFVSRASASDPNSPYAWTNHRPSDARDVGRNWIDGGKSVGGPGAVGTDTCHRDDEPGAAWKIWSCWRPPRTSNTLTPYRVRPVEPAIRV